MNAAKKIRYESLPEGFSPNLKPAIIKLAEKMGRNDAVIYRMPDKRPYLYETDRLVIRRFTPDDAEALCLLANDRMRSVIAHCDHQWPTDLEGCRAAAAWFASGDTFWAVCLKPEMTLIGMIANNSVNEQNILDLGHVWHTAHWGGDLDAEALGLMVQHAFETLHVDGVTAHNPLHEHQIAPLRAIGMTIRSTGKGSFVNDTQGNPLEFETCEMFISREDWFKGYGPKDRPAIISLAERMLPKKQHDTFVEQVRELCSIVDREETLVVGIGIPVSFESPGYGAGSHWPDGVGSYTLNDYFIAKKYITDGTIDLLARALGVGLDSGIVCARYDLAYDGNYKTVVGVVVDSLDNLPEFLPENTVTLSMPACRYAKILINEHQREGRTGYAERMHADEYFIGDFRKETPYVYNKRGVPMYLFDETGDILSKYEPLKIPAGSVERYETIQFRPVLLPPMKIACCTSAGGDDVIAKYFGIQDEVMKTGLAQYYRSDFYGFPIAADNEPGYRSCFGSRVVSFDGLPDGVERITLPGGLYVHVTQLEFNGDNPSIPYEVAFKQMDRLYFPSHPEYEFDKGRKVIARFRQANCASVFVPVKKKEQ